LLVDLTATGVSGRSAAQALDRAGITTNANTVPFDTRKAFDPSGIRLGTPAVTTRGMGAAEMGVLAGWIDRAIQAAKSGDGSALTQLAGEVRELALAFPIPDAPV
jgi:glycine hydroxymethyltransferase